MALNTHFEPVFSGDDEPTRVGRRGGSTEGPRAGATVRSRPPMPMPRRLSSPPPPPARPERITIVPRGLPSLPPASERGGLNDLEFALVLACLSPLVGLGTYLTLALLA